MPTQTLVLIVDDDEFSRTICDITLRTAGYEVLTASSGREALRHSLKGPDVILLDINLPDMSGLAVLRCLNANHHRAQVVLLTAFPTLESAFEGGVAGAVGYVDGPLFGDDVSAVAMQAIQGPHPVRHPRHAISGPSSLTPSPVAAGATASIIDPRIREVMAVIDRDLENSVSLSQLAAQVELSDSRLRHLFYECTRMTLSRYRGERRLQFAAHLLTSTYSDVRQICFRVGFRDVKDFRRRFVRRFGKTPSAYRDQHWGGLLLPANGRGG